MRVESYGFPEGKFNKYFWNPYITIDTLEGIEDTAVN